jgi:integrase
MVKYYRNGRAIFESSKSDDHEEAERILKIREGDIAKGVPVSGRQLKFKDAVADVVNDYKVNGRKSLAHLERRITLHLLPFFGRRRLAAIGAELIREYVVDRQDQGAKPASINRELAIVKRAFALAMQSGRVYAKPHIPMLEEHNVRAGFFSPEQFEAVRRALPAELRPVATFAYYTGWRVPSEILSLQWHQVDRLRGIVRLEPGTTKNDEGREFPYTAILELKDTMEAQFTAAEQLKKRGVICPWVFQRGGKQIRRYDVAWHAACTAAGCPGRIPHDFRRTAVRNLVNAGVPEKTAMLLTGHKTRSVFDRYHILDGTDLRTAVERLAGSLGVVSDAVSAKKVRARTQAKRR